MGISTALLTTHDDTLHTGSAKRDVASGVAGLSAAGKTLNTDGTTIQDSSMKDIVSGIAGLDALKSLSAHRLRCMIGGFGDNWVNEGGLFLPFDDPAQTDFDDVLRPTPGTIYDTSGINLTGVKWVNIVLNAGTYVIKITALKGPVFGILECLHGAVSLGTADLYNAAPVPNFVITFNYSPAVRTVADFRIRSNGKNAASPGYNIVFSRVEIFKTA